MRNKSRKRKKVKIKKRKRIYQNNETIGVTGVVEIIMLIIIIALIVCFNLVEEKDSSEYETKAHNEIEVMSDAHNACIEKGGVPIHNSYFSTDQLKDCIFK